MLDEVESEDGVDRFVGKHRQHLVPGGVDEDVARVVACIRDIRARRAVAPASVLVLASIIAIGAPILYTVSNFGTLFRLRQIIAVELCLLPLVMTLRPRRALDAEGA